MNGVGQHGASNEDSAAVATTLHVETFYLPSRYGQLHLRRVIPPPGQPAARPVVLFTPSPNSSQLYTELLLDLGRDRVALAFDTPGYGQSPAPPEPLANVLEFAELFADALGALGVSDVDAFGHHSGAMLAMALGAHDPARVAHIVVTGAPFICDLSRREALRSRYPTLSTGDAIEAYRNRNWRFWLPERPSDLSLSRAFELYADSLGAGARMNWLYRSVYGDQVDQWLSGLQPPILLLQIDDFLTPHNLEVAKLVAKPTLKERGDLDHFTLITRPREIADEIRLFCDAQTR